MSTANTICLDVRERVYDEGTLDTAAGPGRNIVRAADGNYDPGAAVADDPCNILVEDGLQGLTVDDASSLRRPVTRWPCVCWMVRPSRTVIRLTSTRLVKPSRRWARVSSPRWNRCRRLALTGSLQPARTSSPFHWTVGVSDYTFPFSQRIPNR